MISSAAHSQTQARSSRFPTQIDPAALAQAEAMIEASEDECQRMAAHTDDLATAVERQLADLQSRMQQGRDLQGAAWQALASLASESPRNGTSKVMREVMELRARAVAARREACDAIQATLRERSETLRQLQAHIAECNEQLARMEERRRLETKRPVIKLAPPPVQRDERRTSMRVPVQALVTLSSEDNFYTGFSTDLSDSGVFVATINLQEIGTEIELAITLPDGSKIQCRGEVRWIREWNDSTPTLHPGMGIRFMDLSPAQRSQVRNFLGLRDALFFDA